MAMTIGRLKKQHHKIWTLQDIFNSTDEENIDNFLIDLKGMMIAAYEVRGLIGIESCRDMINEMEWIDDGKHDIHIKIIDVDTK